MSRNLNSLRALMVAIALTALTALTWAQPTVKVGLVSSAPNELQVRLLPNADFDQVVSFAMVTVKYPTTAGISLGAPTLVSGLWPVDLNVISSGTATSGGFTYRTYVMDNPELLYLNEDVAYEWSSGVERPFFTILVTNTSGACVTFTLEDDAYQAGQNIQWYLSLNGQDKNDGYIGGSSSAAQGSPVWNINDNLGFCTIQAAINAGTTDAGETIQVNAGTYVENVNVSKRLTIIGAGSNSQTHVNGGISINASGLSPAGRLVLQDLSVTNTVAGGNGITIGAGFDHIELNNVKASNNAGSGINIVGGVLTEGLVFTDCIINDNGTGAAGTGIRMGAGVNIDGFTITGGEIKRNAQIGFSYNSSTSAVGLTNLSITGTVFEKNGIGMYATSPFTNTGSGDISLFSWNGSATLTDVTVIGADNAGDAAGAVAVQLRGSNTPNPAGTITVNNLNISGHYKRIVTNAPNPLAYGLAIFNYSNVTPISLTNVVVDIGTGHALFAAGLSNTLQLGNTSLNAQNPAYAHILNGTSAQNNVLTNVVATGATFAGVLASSATLPQLFAIEDKVVHGIDEPALGLVRVKAGEVFVTPLSFLAPSTITASIQRGIDKATAGDVVNVASGTYGNNLVANKGVTLLGANAGVSCGSPRGPESLIAPASGLPLNITADGVTIDGFEITAPVHQFAIVGNSRSSLAIRFNHIHHINSSGTPVLTSTHAIQYTVGNSPMAATNVNVSDNCFNNIASSALTNWSASAIGFLQSTTTGTLTGLSIERNTISTVHVNNAAWPTGKIAYGIQLNAGGGAGYMSSTGKIVNAVIADNEISNLSGHIATAIALEGNTENATVTGNKVWNLTSTKNAARAGGGVDLNALKFENNRFVGTVTVANNSFDGSTFTSALGVGVGYGVANYVPEANGGIANVSCNWFGTTAAQLIEDNPGLTGRILNKADAVTNFSPYLVDGTDTDPAIGFQPNPTACTGSPVLLALDNMEGSSCVENADGVIETSVSGGTAPYTYTWTGPSNPGNVASSSALLTGIYQIVVVDNNGSSDTLVVNLPVNDAVPPSITGLPGNFNVDNDPDVCGAVVSWVEPTSADNCAGHSIAQTAGPASGSTFPVGTTTVTYTATDASLNTFSASFTVTVNDAQDPTIVDLPSNITLDNAPGLCGAVATWDEPISADNCAGHSITQTAGPVSGSTFPVGATTVTYTATDASLNTFSASFTVTINDTEDPVWTNCPANISVQNDPGDCTGGTIFWTAPTVNDNCDPAPDVTLPSWSSGNFFPLGITTVTYTAMDVSGNTASCAFTVDVFILDTDNDGVCDEFDCAPGDPNLTTPGAPCNDGDPNTLDDTVTLICTCVGTPFIDIEVDALLDGPYNDATDRMGDNLRVQGLIPAAHPYASLGYAGTETVSPSVLAVNHPDDAIVDWVLIELRDKVVPSVIIARRAALAQRDGDLVDLDGFSPVRFLNVTTNDYHVAVRHRNHLAVMTAVPVTLSGAPANVDFTSTSFANYGTSPALALSAQKTRDGKRMLWAGNAVPDNVLKYLGTANDRDAILVAIGGLVPTNVVTNVYANTDVTMDGNILYLGAGNDRDRILVNLDSNIIGLRIQQLP